MQEAGIVVDIADKIPERGSAGLGRNTRPSSAMAALVLITLINPWGVFARYSLNSAASWPEPAAILLAIVLTFFGAAACYRVGQHMQVTFVRDRLPPMLRRVADAAAELLVAALAGFMALWGYRLCLDTWNQSIAEFPALSVGVTYMPIPLGGVCLMLFAIERLALGRPSAPAAGRVVVPFD
jgi:TRAP-type C4-dicarboxylate transport system permease small subunit